MFGNNVRLRAILMVGCAVVGLASVTLAVPAHAQEAPRIYAIASQDLGSALRAFAIASGRDVVFDPALAKGKTTHGVQGRLVAEAALRQLLAGSGLSFGRTATGGFAVRSGEGANAETTSGSAPASVAQTSSVESVVVTARTKVDTSQEQIKREAPGIVDSTTSRDLEKTVDTSLAEALERLPGVSGDRFYGTSNAGYVTIRGFDSRYNSIDIDGNPIWFSSQNNRGHQIGVFPSAIVNEASVYKTVTPDQDANSIGGHISMRTLRAFDGGGAPYLSLGAQVGRFDQNSITAAGPSGRVYGVGKTTFGGDRQFGVVVGVNYQRTRNTDSYGGADTYAQVNGADLINANLYSNSAYDKQIDTTAVYGKVEAHVTDQLYSFLSVNYFNDHQRLYLDRVGTNISASKTTNFVDGVANFTGATAYTKEYDYNIVRDAKVIGGGLDYRIGEKAVVNLRANYTDFNNDITTLYPETFTLAGQSGAYNLNGDEPSVTIANTAQYDNAANWVNRNTTASYNRGQALNDKVYAVRADYNYNTYAAARGLGLSIGSAWTRLDRDYVQSQANYLLPKGTTLLLSQVTAPGATMANNDAIKMNWNAFWNYIVAHGAVTQTNEATVNYNLVEDVAAAYAALYLTGDKFRLLGGFRYEGTHFSDKTGAILNGVTQPNNYGRSYGNLLPNIQASYDLRQNLRVRAAFTQTIARPDFSDFAAGQTTTMDANGNPVISGSNPNAEPRTSTNEDASLEYYFEGGFASLAIFRKDLKHETFSQQTFIRNAAGQVILTEQEPFNNGSGSVNGLELSFVKSRFANLPAPLNGLGINSNLTILDGHYNVVLADGTRRTLDSLRNQPKYLANVGASYNVGPFSANVTWRARGRSLTTTIGTTPNGDIWILPNNQVDLKAGLRLNHRMKISLEARNLSNTYWKQVTGATGAVYNSVGSGRSYFADFVFTY
jgi:TonB-dependent receptor